MKRKTQRKERMHEATDFRLVRAFPLTILALDVYCARLPSWFRRFVFLGGDVFFSVLCTAIISQFVNKLHTYM